MGTGKQSQKCQKSERTVTWTEMACFTQQVYTSLKTDLALYLTWLVNYLIDRNILNGIYLIKVRILNILWWWVFISGFHENSLNRSMQPWQRSGMLHLNRGSVWFSRGANTEGSAKQTDGCPEKRWTGLNFCHNASPLDTYWKIVHRLIELRLELGSCQYFKAINLSLK